MTDVASRPTNADERVGPDSGRGADRSTTSVPRHGFRPGARRRSRIAMGIALGAVAVALNVMVYTNLDGRAPAVQVIRDVPAGSPIAASDLRVVDVDVDESVPTVSGDQLDGVVGRYARVRLTAGALVVESALADRPLVSAASSVVALRVPDGSLPEGLRERVPVRIVIPSPSSAPDDAPVAIDGRVVGLPRELDASLGQLSLSVEVADGDAAALAAADDPRVVLLEPIPDPAADEMES